MNKLITVGNGKLVPVQSKGILLAAINDNINASFTDILKSIEMSTSLLSISHLTATGHRVVFEDDYCEIQLNPLQSADSQQDPTAKRHLSFSAAHDVPTVNVRMDDNLVHQQLGHASSGRLKKLQLPHRFDFCEACAMGKITIPLFPRRFESDALH